MLPHPMRTTPSALSVERQTVHPTRQRHHLTATLAIAISLSGVALAPGAAAQVTPPDSDIQVGDWAFSPTLEIRVRGQLRVNPIDLGGDQYERTGVQADGYRSAAPEVVRRTAPVDSAWWLEERARLGVGVVWKALSAKVVLQDARVLSVLPGAAQTAEDAGMDVFSPFEMYLDVRDQQDDPSIEFRLGRQQLQWGDGRLIGKNDWLARGGALDAARVRAHIGDVELEALALLLALPGSLPSPYPTAATDVEPAADIGSGAQLYGLRADVKFTELFNAEVAALARVARDPLPSALMPGDSYTLDARVYGEQRGFRYAAEGALQLGRAVGYGVNRDVLAFAVAAYADWQTALPWQLRFRLDGAYASGDDSDGIGDSLNRFDPLLPEVHNQHGQMDLYSWSNLIEGAASVFAKPLDEFELSARYALVGLAEANDRLSTGALYAVGAAPQNGSQMLGHELDARLNYQPWDKLTLGAGYGMMLLGEGGKTIINTAGRGDRNLLHHAYLQAQLNVP